MDTVKCSWCGKDVDLDAKNLYVEQLLSSEQTTHQKQRTYCNKQHFNKAVAKKVILELQSAGKIDMRIAMELLEQLSP